MTRYMGIKISEEGKVALESIANNYRPGVDQQDIVSDAVMEYIRAYYPDLEPEIETTMRRRMEARLDDEEARQP
jgi:hypothetical protein